MTSFTVKVPAGFEPTFASIFRPQATPTGMSIPAKYGCAFPASELTEDILAELGSYTPGGWRSHVKEGRKGHGDFVMARSNAQPLIIPGLLTTKDLAEWQSLLNLCDVTNMPRDWVFRERELELLVEPWEWDRTPYGWGVSLALLAVRIVDLREGFLCRHLYERLDSML